MITIVASFCHFPGLNTRHSIATVKVRIFNREKHLLMYFHAWSSNIQWHLHWIPFVILFYCSSEWGCFGCKQREFFTDMHVIGAVIYPFLRVANPVYLPINYKPRKWKRLKNYDFLHRKDKHLNTPQSPSPTFGFLCSNRVHGDCIVHATSMVLLEVNQLFSHDPISMSGFTLY